MKDKIKLSGKLGNKLTKHKPVAKKRNVTDSRSIGFKEQRSRVSFFSINGATNVKISSNEILSSW